MFIVRCIASLAIFGALPLSSVAAASAKKAGTPPLPDWLWSQEASVEPDEPDADGQFGWAVDVDGDTALVGARLDGDMGNGSGSVYVYVRSGASWSLQAKLTAPDGVPEAEFGCDVSLDGNTALIGAWRDDERGIDAGAAYVFVRRGTSWRLQAKLTAADAAGGDWFGKDVSLDGNTALVGAYGGEGYTGAAYVFERTGSAWTQQQKLVDPNGEPGDDYGWTVSLDVDTALVGAQGGSGSGEALVYVRSGSAWNLQATLAVAGGDPSDVFSRSLVLDGDTALVGAWGDDDAGIDAGAVHVFVRTGTTWNHQAKLHSDVGVFFANFGHALALDGNMALIGARNDFTNGVNTGAAYVFLRSGSSWNLEAKLVSDDAEEYDFFGSAVALDGGTAVMGTPYRGGFWIDPGGAYFFEREAWASAAFRNDSGNTNPTGFTATAPVMGEDWVATVDNSATGNFAAGVLGFVNPLEAILPPTDDFLLVDPFSPGGELLQLPPAYGYSLVTFTVPIPVDPILAGFIFSTQGGGFGGGGGAHLHNAYDLFVGR